MARFLTITRYLIIIPIVGLGLAAAAFFVLGGINLIQLLVEIVGVSLGLAEQAHFEEPGQVIFEVVEHVHQFLIGTVLYITAIGFYQLFIDEIQFHGWLKIENTDELETSLVGVTVVVLAVNFLGVVFAGEGSELLLQGAGIALPIAALGVFLALRAWAARMDSERMEAKKVEDTGPRETDESHEELAG
jgi:uncharacterized membrane protein YqhA